MLALVVAALAFGAGPLAPSRAEARGGYGYPVVYSVGYSYPGSVYYGPRYVPAPPLYRSFGPSPYYPGGYWTYRYAYPSYSWSFYAGPRYGPYYGAPPISGYYYYSGPRYYYYYRR
jgi:hypothetical protein